LTPVAPSASVAAPLGWGKLTKAPKMSTKKKTRIVRLERLMGPCDLTRDREIAEYEVARRHGSVGGFAAFVHGRTMPRRSRSLDEITDSYLLKALAALR